MPSLTPAPAPDARAVATQLAASSTFVPNMKLPVHGWFRFSAGYSAEWAQGVMAEHARGAAPTVLDPFCGSGTTLIAAEAAGLSACGVESHPFLARIAQAKLLYREDPELLLEHAARVREHACTLEGDVTEYAVLIRRCFTDEALQKLDALRRASLAHATDAPASALVWLCLLSILRRVSHVGTAPWQYVLPSKRKQRPSDPYTAFDAQVARMVGDMRLARTIEGPRSTLLSGDARTLERVADDSVDLVVTSPPYPNNFDYADATRLEMTFMREIRGWGDLQHVVRRHLVRSCSQHCPERALSLPELLAAPELGALAPELARVCQELSRLRTERRGRKTYHLMVACYFLDMARVWGALRRVCREGSRVCLVVGDSAPYGVHVPVADWMRTLALAAGFGGARFEKTRDRNIKWRNRVHRVPLCEGRLWVDG